MQFVCCAPSRPALSWLLFSSRYLLSLAGATWSWAEARTAPVGMDGIVLPSGEVLNRSVSQQQGWTSHLENGSFVILIPRVLGSTKG